MFLVLVYYQVSGEPGITGCNALAVESTCLNRRIVLTVKFSVSTINHKAY